MLRAIHNLIDCLGLYEETLTGAEINDSKELRDNPDTYFHREKLLPDVEGNEALTERFFGGVRKPVFTTVNAQNHLISLSEVMAMYLLVWSPVCWRLIDWEQPALRASDASIYHHQQSVLDTFVAGLPCASRVMAHVPNYMIFDDHDVTDDWNLSALWEATTYGHPFSRRRALFLRLRCAAQASAGPAQNLADHQQWYQERVSPHAAGMAGPDQSLALCTLVTAQLVYQETAHAGDAPTARGP